jgi:hypothetical protein
MDAVQFSRRMAKLTRTLDGALHFSRARNSDGEFAPQAVEGPDPKAMARVYGSPETRQRGMGIVATAMGGAGAITAAALLARKLRGRMARA